MSRLALRSLRHRPTACAATFLAVLLGTALVGSFAGLAETALAVQGPDRQTLVIMGAIVGGWGAVIVLYSVIATLGITTRQRAGETALLRTIGATPWQVRRLVLREALLVCLVAAAGGAGLAAAGGPALFGAVRGAGLVADTVAYGGGPVSLTTTATVLVLASVGAVSVAARRATRGTVATAVRASGTEPARPVRWRTASGGLLVAAGLSGSVVTILTGHHPQNPYLDMATCGSASILVGVGLAVLGPLVLPLLVRSGAGPLNRTAPGHLATFNAARRPHLLAGVLGPVIVLTAAAVGVLMLVGIDRRTMTDPAFGADGDVINLLNLVVTGMISLFAALMVVNAFAAVTAGRRAELGRLRLVGAGPAQVRGSVLVEAAIVAVVGIGLGLLASLATIVPFAVVRDEGLVPDGQLWLPWALAAGVGVLTLGSADLAVRRVTRRGGRGDRPGTGPGSGSGTGQGVGVR